ncbi:hypothetical protein ToLCCV_gp2 [Tomato leaf curl Cameroon virus]|uniref:hypothetical protein n=1 Tax=Tomato leaf curl Cameroon virus TaxID=693894 RepID=UPI0001960111|nr:hypothetical protein ToLCCV_gp2 [Tomato leaf curl Cameroon virus]CAR65254.1 hypothetical protein [Tomato leaf curl Cameroon virus - [Cameroon:Buea:Okra:2008]]
MSTSHIQQQSILSMVGIFSLLLMIIDDMIVKFKKSLHQSLFLASRRTTNNSCTEFTQHLITVSEIILDCSCTRLVVEHVKNLAKITWAAIRPI